jgi:hypothetical protein
MDLAANHIEILFAKQTMLFLESPRMRNVVSVHARNQWPASNLSRGIRGCRDATMRALDKPQSRVANAADDTDGLIGRTVIDDNQFEVGKRLSKD